MLQDRIGIGSDHAGFRLKESVRRWLVEHSYSVLDLGTYNEEACDYPDFAIALAEVMGAGEIDRGILICGTGVGMSIVANKFSHLRAAVCHDPTTARFSRAHNDSNILTLGSRITGEMVALVSLRQMLPGATRWRSCAVASPVNAAAQPLRW